MPRRPTFIHPLRRVREAINKTQKEFAKTLGVSAVTITSIENGVLAISAELANRVYAATGAAPKSILAPRKGRKGFSKKRISAMIPRDANGHPFDSGSFDWHHAAGDIPGANIVLIMRAAALLDVLLSAADNTGKFNSVLFSFYQWLQSATKHAGLNADARRVAANRKPFKERFRETLHKGRPLSVREEAEFDRIFKKSEAGLDENGVLSWPTDIQNSWLTAHKAMTKTLINLIRQAEAANSQALEGGLISK